MDQYVEAYFSEEINEETGVAEIRFCQDQYKVEDFSKSKEKETHDREQHMFHLHKA